MRRTFAFLLAGLFALLLSACSQQSAETGPVVFGKLSTETSTSYIPFSPYASGNPVIATEAFATPGIPKVLGAGGSNAKYQDGDYLILNGAGTFAIAPAATTKTNGVPDGSKFILQNYKSGVVNPVTYGSSCYAVTGNCPTSMAYGDTWLYTVDQVGGFYRAMKIGNADMAWIGANYVPLVNATKVSFNTVINNRKVELWPGANDHQFYGFGVNSNLLRYQTSGSVADHAWFSGASATASTELFRVYGVGGFATYQPSYIASTNTTRSKLQLSKYAGGSGHTDGPKWNTTEMQYLLLGGTEYSAGSVRGMGLGYVANNAQFAPAFVGYQEVVQTGNTNGDLFFATRPTNTNVVPTERLRILASGDIKVPTVYAPATPQSLTQKAYVDAQSLTPAAITAIKALTASSTLADVIAALKK